MRLHKALALILACLLTFASIWPVRAQAALAGADSGLDQNRSFHLPTLTVQGTILHDSDFTIAIASGKSINLYQTLVSQPLTIPVGERIVHVGLSQVWGFAAISESGTLYTFQGLTANTRGTIAPPEGRLWTEADVGPLTELKAASANLVKVGSQVYRIDQKTYTVTPWGPPDVQQLLNAGDVPLVIAGSEGDYRLIGLDVEGQEVLAEPAANSAMVIPQNGKLAYFLTPDRMSIRAVDSDTLAKSEWKLDLPGVAEGFDVYRTYDQTTIIANLGDRVVEYAAESGAQLGDLQLPEAGLVVYSRSSFAKRIIRYINSQGIFEYLDEELIWVLPKTGLDLAKHYHLSEGFAVVDRQGFLHAFRSTTDTLDRASLLPGHGFMLYRDSPFAEILRVGLLAHDLPQGLGLGYQINTISDTGEEETIGLGVLTDLTLFGEIPIPSGEAYLLITPVPIDESLLTEGTSLPLQPVQFSLALAGWSSLGQLADLAIESPEQGHEFWGSATSVTVKARTNAYRPVLFLGHDAPVMADTEGYAERSTPLTGELMEGTAAFAVSVNGHVTYATLLVINHWLPQQPTAKATVNGKMIISVPDASLIDLEQSTLQIAGVSCTLTADSTGKRLIGTPESSLPLGPAKAQLTLIDKAAADEEQALLEALQWDVTITSTRIARLWIGKRSGEIDGASYGLEAAPYVSASRTMVPIRFVGDAMQARLGWNNNSKQASFELNGQKVVLTIGSRKATVNGEAVLLDAAPVIVNGRTFVPLRFVSENLGAKVDWQGAIKQITLTIE